MGFYDFLYYNGVGLTTVSIGFFTLEYLSDPDNFIKNMSSYTSNILFWSIDKVITLKMLYNTHIKSSIKNIYNKDNNIEMFDVTNNYKRYYECGEEKNEKQIYVINTVEKNGKIYKKSGGYDDNSNDEICVSNPYMSIELTYNGKTYDLTNTLKQYHIVGNYINYDLIVILMLYELKIEHIQFDDIHLHYTLSIFKNDFSNEIFDETATIKLVKDSFIVFYDENDDGDDEETQENCEDDESNYDTDDMSICNDDIDEDIDEDIDDEDKKE